MDPMTQVLTVAAIATAVLIAAVIFRVGSLRGRAGMILAFVALAALPLSITGLGTWTHLEHAKSRAFCLSCHEMTPYGKSLHVDDPSALPAAHFQNHRVPSDRACYACHTTYTMYGDLDAKLKGIKHVWVHYFGEIPSQIALYEPYQNRECMYCHAGARSFEESEMHGDLHLDLASGETSCLDCHDVAHAVAELDAASFWRPPPVGAP